MYAVFPLNIVVLPNESVALHLFEPRYRQLFRDYKEGEEFAIVYKDKAGLADFGTLVYIEKVVNEFPDETVDVIVKGSSIIKVKEFHETYPDKLYSGIEAEEIDHSHDAKDNLKALFKLYLEAVGKRINKNQPLDLFYIANRLELDAETKNELISLNSSAEINCFLMNQIRFLEKIREQESLLQSKFHLN
ncbi:MAG: LON peptidase substrate-binding domain-containing protein [Vicingaceae bacterium]